MKSLQLFRKMLGIGLLFVLCYESEENDASSVAVIVIHVGNNSNLALYNSRFVKKILFPQVTSRNRLQTRSHHVRPTTMQWAVIVFFSCKIKLFWPTKINFCLALANQVSIAPTSTNRGKCDKFCVCSHHVASEIEWEVQVPITFARWLCTYFQF